MRLASIVVLGVAGSLVGCASGGGSDRGTSFGERGPSTVTVEINNRNFERATIHWNTNGLRQRLGVVEGLTTETFTVDRFTVSRPVQLEIDQTAGSRCITREIVADPGDHLYLEIAPTFRDTANCI